MCVYKYIHVQKIFVITSAEVDRFSEFLHRQISKEKEIFYATVTKTFNSSKYVATENSK